ncbi:uncharacterized protein [Solanum tuberosum]|uniref:uncharacterized protein n=1 Tax=Solanum tuberosum TaxID=4113 RepID=UPI00073A42E7|nr:PREDICTED: uncharacterized protein LOC107058020 [Solanum tuberosum]
MLSVLGEERKGKKLKRCHAGNIEHYQISINSYRLQGIKKSAQRFVPIPFAPDGLTEEFYDLHAYNPAESKFIMKLQVHPERMSQEDSHGFDLLIRYYYKFLFLLHFKKCNEDVLGEERKGKKLKRWHAGNIEHYQISINSYRLQGIKKSAQRFVPIPFAPDGLTEEFYDLHAYNPAESKFIMKLQVHPERMSQEDSHRFDLLIRYYYKFLFLLNFKKCNEDVRVQFEISYKIVML